jgi:hypothetical protein
VSVSVSVSGMSARCPLVSLCAWKIGSLLDSHGSSGVGGCFLCSYSNFYKIDFLFLSFDMLSYLSHS